MVDPQVMCRKHLLGEHVELHMMAAWLLKGKNVSGWAESNCLEPRSVGARHRALVVEMHRRGYNHRSPLRQPKIGAHQCPLAGVDAVAALVELTRRCLECAALADIAAKVTEWRVAL